jgi:hypothetical protein
MADATSLVLAGGNDELSARREVPVPTVMGWASAAVAIQSVRRIPTPVLLRLDVVGFGSLTVDFRHHAYEWDTPLESFPEEPTAVLIETHPTTPDAPAPFALPAQDLDGLLWLIGKHAFPARAATWLWEGDRYRLGRRPDLGDVPLTLEEVRMTAILTNAAVTPAELADAVGAPVEVAQRLVNAYSLMGILRAEPAEGAPVAHLPAAPSRGILERLRTGLRTA